MFQLCLFALLKILVESAAEDRFEILTLNLFDNLQGHQKLLAENDLTEISKTIIDKQVESYLNLAERTASTSAKKKRSLSDRLGADTGAYMLNGIEPSITIPTTFPTDIALFHQNNSWYAASLESARVQDKSDSLVIFKYHKNNNSFLETTRSPVNVGVRLSTISYNNTTLIAVAENDTAKLNFQEKSGIFLYNASEKLTKIQSLDMSYASDIAMWEIHDEIFMSVANFMSNNSGNISYELEMPVYKFLGNHFAKVQSISSKGARRVTPFKIGHSNYLAVANSKDDTGNTKIYSEIYKFNYHSEKYELYQRILTRACTDIQFFSFAQDLSDFDDFLIVANSFQEDLDGNIDYEAYSIVYKFVDNYFIPFQSFLMNGIEQWLPVQGINQELAIFSLSRFDGLVSFQYDGWSFIEVPQITLRGTDIKSIRSYNFNDSHTLVVANKNNNGNSPNVFQLKFEHNNFLSDLHNELLDWCNSNFEKIQFLNTDSVDNILGIPQRSDIDEEFDSVTSTENSFEINSDISEINSQLESLSLKLDDLETETNKSLQNNDPKEIKQNITADEIIFNNNVFFNNINSDKINEVRTQDLFEKTVNISGSFELDHLQFNSLKVENEIEPQLVNDQPASTLVHCSDGFELTQFTVRGNLTASDGVTVEGLLNGVNVTEGNILLSDRDQIIQAPVTINELEVDSIQTVNLNGNELVSQPTELVEVDHINNLTVTNLVIGGYINEVDLPALDKLTLKIFGDQEIISKYTFDSISGRNLESLNGVSGRKLEDLIPIDGGNYAISQDLIMKETLTVNNLTVINFLSGIQVNNLSLDVVLKDSVDLQLQEVTGHKIFDNVEILNPINVRTKIKNHKLRKMNPLISLQEELVVEGDKVITGDVDIDFVKLNDLITADGAYSLNKLKAQGLSLNENMIQPKLQFMQQIDVDEIFVDKINDVEVVDLVVNGGNDAQIIQGTKFFKDNLFVTGSTSVSRINSIEASDFENDVMKIEGDQIITGKTLIKRVIANKISSNLTKLGLTPLNDSMTSGSKIIEGDFDPEEIINITAKSVIVKGLVNDLNFDKIVQDTVRVDGNSTIPGRKIFENLSINSLKTAGLSLPEVSGMREKVELDGPLDIKQISAKNVNFDSSLNGVEKNRFGKASVDESNAQIVEGGQDVGTIHVLKRVFVASNQINGVNIDDLIENTVKLDESFDFDKVTFETAVVSKAPVLLAGHIENVDFDDVVLSDSGFEQVVLGEKVFRSSLTVEGDVNFNGHVSGFDLNGLCEFAAQSLDVPKNLTIEGNAYFSKGPNVDRINSVPLQRILENAWLDGEEAVLSGYVEFEDVIFKNDIEIEGFLDNVSLTLLSETYFSKSREQHIPATLTFNNDTIFENEVAVFDIALDGEVNGINIEEFVRNTLLHDYDQIFETEVYIENCKIEELTGEFAVNGMNLETEVMRYDKMNMVTGRKIFQNLNIDNLKIGKSIKVQGVDIWDWMKKSVRKTGVYDITGSKTIKNVAFKNGLKLRGVLNNQHFNEATIMLKDVPQDITGRKTIFSNSTDPVVFKGIKLKGFLQGVEVSELINNQAYKNSNNTFKMPLNFSSNLTANNVIITKTFQGMNMTELIANVSSLAAVNNLLENYKSLFDMSMKIKRSIETQANFLHHFKTIQKITGMTNSMKVLCPDGVTRLGALYRNGSQNKLELYGWHPEIELFMRKQSMHFTSEHLSFFDQIMMGHYFYMEENDDSGRFIRLDDSMEHIFTISSNNTRSTTSFVKPENNGVCTLFIYYTSNPKVFCETYEHVDLMQELDGLATKATSVTIQDTLYLLVINQPINKVQPHITSWKLNNTQNKFEIHQLMFETEPKSLAAINYNRFTYLVIASGHLPNAKYSGRIEVKRFDGPKGEFMSFQSWDLDAPIQVEFAILPTNELILYVVTDNPTEPMIVYRFEGIAGFKQIIVGSALPKIRYISQFMGGNGGHFVLAQSYDEVGVVKAVFKGDK